MKNLIKVLIGLILLSFVIAIIVKFGLLILGIGLLIWGFMKRKEDQKQNIHRRLPAVLALLGLVIGIIGVGVAFTGPDSNEEFASTQVESEATKTTPPKNSDSEESKEEASTQDSNEDKKDTSENAKSQDQNNNTSVNDPIKNLPVATVTRVVDGDTIEVMYNGKEEDVRLLLVDTPETVHPRKPVEPFGPEASKFVKEKLEGKEVHLKIGTEERDNYGRLLAYVFIGEETIQELLLRNGLAQTAYLYNDLTMLDEFHKEQDIARKKKIGVWSIEGYAHVDHDHGFHYEEKKSVATTTKPKSEPKKETPKSEPKQSSNLKYDPNGPDRNCGDFDTQAEAQAFMEASGPGDPHRLDGNDNDGLACESLP